MNRFAPFLLVLLLACCSSPEPSFFTLAPVPGTPSRGGPALVELRRPGLAGYLDRSDIVRTNSPYQLQLNSGERWAAPLGDMIGRVLAQDLTSRLPGTNVFTSTGAISADANAAIEIDVQRFEANPSGKVELVAQVAVTRNRARGSAQARTIRLAVMPANGTTASLVAAMSTALGQMADEVAGMLRGR